MTLTTARAIVSPALIELVKERLRAVGVTRVPVDGIGEYLVQAAVSAPRTGQPARNQTCCATNAASRTLSDSPPPKELTRSSSQRVIVASHTTREGY